MAIVTDETEAGREVLRHSTAHVMAQAVRRLWPGAKYAIGPAIENGFNYDFDRPGGAHFSDDDLERIEAEMRAIVKEDQPFVRSEHDLAEGLEIFAEQPYKQEIIQAVESGADEVDAAGSVVSTYRNSDDFVDLCRGPHVPSTVATTAALASPRPMECASSAAVVPSVSSREEPSGRRTEMRPAIVHPFCFGRTRGRRPGPDTVWIVQGYKTASEALAHLGRASSRLPTPNGRVPCASGSSATGPRSVRPRPARPRGPRPSPRTRRRP